MGTPCASGSRMGMDSASPAQGTSLQSAGSAGRAPPSNTAGPSNRCPRLAARWSTWPGRTGPAAPVEDEWQGPVQVGSVDHAVAKRFPMHAAEVLFGKARLHSGMETLFKLARDVRPFHADGRVHGVIGRSAVHANPTELHRHRPGGEAVVRPRMFAEVSREVLLGHASIVTCPPGV